MMMSTRRNMWVPLFITVLLVEGWFSECEGCLKQESDALLQLHAHFGGDIDWFNNEGDCCQWKIVECNNTTRRVVKLNLYQSFYVTDQGVTLNMSYFHAFEDLRSIDLRGNGIAACVESEGADKPLRLSNLRDLDLSFNMIYDTSNILPCLSGLSSLKTLNMESNDLTVKSFHREGQERLPWPTSLEFLFLRDNIFSNDIISSLTMLQHLQWLDLSNNQLEGSVDISGLCALIKLEMLDLSGNININSFVVPQGTNLSLSSMKVLKLNYLKMDGSMLQKSLRAFSSIRELSLENYAFKETFVAGDFGDLDNLESLSLSGSYIESEFFRNIGALASLKILSVRYCSINGTLSIADWSNLQKLKVLELRYNEFEGPLPITGWFKLKKLEELYLGSNKFEGLFPLSFVNMTSLRTLDFSDNSFRGNIANLATLPSLEYLDFSRNQLEVIASFTFLANHSKLKFVYGDGNKLVPDTFPTSHTWVPRFQLQEFSLSWTTKATSLPLPNFLIHQYNLSLVDLTGSKFEAEFPKWVLENNTKMTTFVIRNCSFSGHFQLPSHPFPNIESIDASNNAITGQIPGNNISSIFPNLITLNLSRNAIDGSFPCEFGHINSLYSLDLSYNHLSGEIPKNISMGSSNIGILNLSNNRFHGQACSTFVGNISSLQHLLLDGNSFSGSIEGCFINMSTLMVLDLSNNDFVGKIPRLDSLELLEGLSMANNHLEGSLPAELFDHSNLLYVDLSDNNLSGSIPSFANSYSSYINLSNNRLSGLAKKMFSENSPALSILDLSNNEITSTLQHLISNASELSILLLRGNYFLGQIPNELCQLKDLSIVDLSHNRLSGPLPVCLSKISFGGNGKANDFPFYYPTDDSSSFAVEKQVNFTTKRRSYTYKGNILLYMSGIDLSHNDLNGTIPPELGNLTYIKAMNLSNNHLTGDIPTTFSNMKQIESLDLSYNKLSGRIPPELIELNSLEIFSLAHNNLSGSTPERKGQFITFDESCYEGNPLLCGLPLNESCTSNNGPSYDVDRDENYSSMDMQFFYISFIVSYASVLLVMAIVLCINLHWRRAWFCFIEFVITNCYHFIEYNFYRWFNH